MVKKAWKIVIGAAVAWTMVACEAAAPTITILHTNDTHSQVEPKANGKGGYAPRITVIEEERKKDKNVVLVDAGDFSQGTPYFNYFHGRVEVDALNRMGYDAVTLGNHEFDNGIDTLAAVLKDAKFAVVCANYKVEGTALEGIIKPYTIIERGGRKIGIFGIGVYPYSLIASKNFEGIEYLEPYEVAQKTADELRAKGCDIVVCLSHMGTYTSERTPSDVEMVKCTKNIDVVIGGHTHKVYENERIVNAEGKEIPVCQAGKSGEKIGKIVFHFEGK